MSALWLSVYRIRGLLPMATPLSLAKRSVLHRPVESAAVTGPSGVVEISRALPGVDTSANAGSKAS
jgi:hypothetical protein